MPAGGTFVMTVPSTPCRCPPGPYERARVVADWHKRNRRGSCVVVLDANRTITAERENFTRAFEVTHAGVITYLSDAPVEHVDVAARTIHTAMGPFTGDVLNVIPANIGPKSRQDLGVANAAGGFAGRRAGLRIDGGARHPRDRRCLGDHAAQGGTCRQPEGKVRADAILRLLGEGSRIPRR